VPTCKKSQRSLVAVAPVGGTEISPQHMVFGPPALVAGEDHGAYEDLRSAISDAVGPKDFLEEIWVRDVVDLTWDTLRMRRLKASFLTSTTSDGLNALLRPLLGFKAAEAIAREWAVRDRAAVKIVDQHLKAMGLNMDAAIAQALAMRIDQFERIDRMVMNAEGRRNAALREVERHRSSLAQALRQASDEVIEAEFEDVPAQEPALEAAA
jgi:hypothetical protein